MVAKTPQSYCSHLKCPVWGQRYSGHEPVNCCACGRPPLARYDLVALQRDLCPSDYSQRPPGLWRYRALLPVLDAAHIIGLGEGGTPLLRVRRLGAQLGFSDLYLSGRGLQSYRHIQGAWAGDGGVQSEGVGHAQIGHPNRWQRR
jgi:threonine synthase